MNELKPCPFCGHKARQEIRKIGCVNVAVISCLNCGANVRSPARDADWLITKVWNDRVSEKSAPADNNQFIEYLQKELETVKAENQKLKNENEDMDNRLAKIARVFEILKFMHVKNSWW